MATGYGLEDRFGVQIPERKTFDLGVQTGSGTHPAPYTIGTGGKAAEASS
jgi:hypothetical protein